MKSERINNNIHKPNYPYLGEFNNIDYKYVVLFTEPKTGVVVHATKSEYPVGCVKNTWAEELFTPFNGKIVLTND